MKITIISPFSFGYIDALAQKISSLQEVELTFIKTDELIFNYESPLQKLQNYFLKIFLARNMKKQFQTKKILETLSTKPKQNVILVIRPDKLEKALLIHLKSKTSRLTTYFFDSLHNIPKQFETIPYFDDIFTYDPDDASKYNLKFITNFIPKDRIINKKDTFTIFNISSYDERYPLLKKIALQLQSDKYPYKFIVRKEKPFISEGIEIVPNYISLSQVQEYLEESKILLDIQKTNQKGLSFRVFEALGYDKKLITTNEDVQKYDFFRPENIFILDKKYPTVPKSFLIQPCIPIPEKIKKKYRREAWFRKVFLQLNPE